MSGISLFGGWGKNTKLAVAESTTGIATTQPTEDVEIYSSRPISGRPRGEIVQVRSKAIVIGGKKHDVDPRQLIRMIKQVTQTIGEYKRQNNPYSDYIIAALRKARGDMVNDLESHFRIHWEIDEESGRSQFYM